MTDIENLPKLSIGDKAPDFSAETQSGEKITLSHLLKTGQKILLIFYPGDDTPGCTKQLCGVRDIYSDYQKYGVRVLGVNHASAKSHQKFIDKYDYKFDIIVDEGKSIISKYGALKKFFKNLTIKRGVFLIDENGIIQYIYWGQHDNSKVLEILQKI
ncbi:MAG: peroxiredoxin [Patescibacteria group bacterium]